MDRDFELVAKGWLAQYKADIMGKVRNLLEENEANPEELAEEINVDVEEVYDILDGNAEDISVYTLIRIFMVLGLAVEIKPIEQTPLGCYNNVNPHVLHEQPQREERRAPQPNPFTCPPIPMGLVGMPPNDFNPSMIPPHIRRQMEEGEERVAPRFTRRDVPREPASPFEAMDDDRLKRIIRHELWDSEINLATASHRELVSFLDEKNKRKQSIMREDKEHKEIEDLERDPRVAEFVKDMKRNIKENPQFRSYMKNFMKNLEEE